MAAQAILFDLFDTLIDLSLEKLPTLELGGRRVPTTYGAIYEVLGPRIAMDFERFSRELAAVDRLVRRRIEEEGLEYPTRDRFIALLDRLGRPDVELAERLTQTHMGLLRETAEVRPQHAELLEELHADSRLGVCSNFSHAATAESLLDEAGLRSHLDAVVISEQVGFRKPRPEIFRAALERLGARPETAVHVGDSLSADIAGAGALGITTVWLTRRVPEPQRRIAEYTGPPPAHVIADLAELPDVLRSCAA
ncbi:MAG: HAD family hydrolase [Myxococcota bacterium]